jgi:hypothetical protein
VLLSPETAVTLHEIRRLWKKGLVCEISLRRSKFRSLPIGSLLHLDGRFFSSGFRREIGVPPVYTGFPGPAARAGSNTSAASHSSNPRSSSATKSPDHTTAFRFKRRQRSVTLARTDASASGSSVCLRCSLSFVSITLSLRHCCRWLRPDILPWLPCKAHA